MGFSAEVLGSLLDSSPKCGDRNPRPSLVKLLKRKPIGKHIDDLGNLDTRSFNGQFAACPIRA